MMPMKSIALLEDEKFLPAQRAYLSTEGQRFRVVPLLTDGVCYLESLPLALSRPNYKPVETEWRQREDLQNGSTDPVPLAMKDKGYFPGPQHPVRSMIPDGGLVCNGFSELAKNMPNPRAADIRADPEPPKPARKQATLWLTSATEQLYLRRERDAEEQHTGTPQISDSITTLMLRGIPCAISQEQLKQAVDNLGFSGKYDFLYLPRFRNASNRGYAFVNFEDASQAAAFATAFTKYHFAFTRSKKVCSVQPAHLQGLQRNYMATSTNQCSRPFVRLPGLAGK